MKRLINQVPLLKVFLPFLAGIILAVNFQLAIPFAIPVIGLLLFSYLIIEKFLNQYLLKRLLSYFIFGSIFFLLGFKLVEVNTAVNHQDFYGHHIEKGKMAIVKVIEPPVPKAKSIKAKVQVQQVKQQNNWLKTSGETIIYFRTSEEAAALKYGDVLLVEQQFNDIPPPKNPNEFNYKRYLRFHQIYHQSFLKNEQWQVLQRDQGNLFFATVYKSRAYFSSILKEKIENPQARAVTSALLLGQRDLLDQETIRAYSGTGAMHVLAVSGLHVGIIYLLLNQIFSFLNSKRRMKRYLKPFLILICIWLYASITGLSPSVMRAATMFSFLAIAKISNRQGNIYGSITASAFILLIIDPFIITEVGFMLSYLAVIGIIALQPHIERLIYLENPILKKVWQITSVSLAAQIATFPVGLLFFYQFPTYFLISNLIVIPAAMIILITGILLFIVSPIAFAANIVGVILSTMVMWLNNILKFIQQLPFSILQGVSISVFETIIIYGFIISITAFLLQKQLKLLYLPLSLLIILTISIGFDKLQNLQNQELVVYHVPGQSAIGLINGKEIIFYANKALTADEDKMLFHIRHHWWNKNLNNIHFAEAANEINFTINNKKVAVVFTSTDLNHIEKGTEILILKKHLYNYEQLKEFKNLEKIILDNGAEKGLTKEKLAAIAIPVHDVSAEGAFILKN